MDTHDTRPNRVHIIGGAGSGKTTLAQEYARQCSVSHHDLDHIMWTHAAARQPRPETERDLLLQQTIASDQWVTEGIFWQAWVAPAFERADKIILLNIPEAMRHYRVIKRHFQLLRQADRADYHLFFPTLLELIRLNRLYQRGPYKRTLQALSGFMEKVEICTSNKEASRALGI